MKIKETIIKVFKWIFKSLEDFVLKTKFMARPKFEEQIFTYSAQSGLCFSQVSVKYDNSEGAVGKYFASIYQAIGKATSLKPSHACALAMGPAGILCYTLHDMYDLFSVTITIDDGKVDLNKVGHLYDTTAYANFYCDQEENIEKGMQKEEFEKRLFRYKAYYMFSSLVLNTFFVAKDIAKRVAEIILHPALISTIYGIVGIIYLTIVIGATKMAEPGESLDTVTKLRKLEAMVRTRRRFLASLVNFSKKVKKEELALRHASWVLKLCDKMENQDEALIFITDSPSGFKPMWIKNIESEVIGQEENGGKLHPDQAQRVIDAIKERIPNKEAANEYAEEVYRKTVKRFKFWNMFRSALKAITKEVLFEVFVPNPGRIVVYTIAFLILSATLPFGSIWIPVALVIVGIVLKPVIEWINNQFKETLTHIYLRMTYLRQKLPALDRWLSISLANNVDCKKDTAFYEFAARGNAKGLVLPSDNDYRHPCGNDFKAMLAAPAA